MYFKAGKFKKVEIKGEERLAMKCGCISDGRTYTLFLSDKQIEQEPDLKELRPGQSFMADLQDYTSDDGTTSKVINAYSIFVIDAKEIGEMRQALGLNTVQVAETAV